MFTGFAPPGSTDTPNQVFDEMKNLNEAELKVLLCVVRKTLGWHKKRDQISLSQICTMTGLVRSAVARAINSLEERNMIVAEQVKAKDGTFYPSSYGLKFQSDDGGVVLPEGLGGSPPRRTRVVLPEGHTKEIELKDFNNKNNNNTPLPPKPEPDTASETDPVNFGRFSELWRWQGGFRNPNKSDAARAEVGWESVDPISEKDLLDAMRAYKASDWGKANKHPIMGFVKDPTSWLRSAEAAPVDLPPIRLEPITIRPAPAGRPIQKQPAPDIPAMAVDWNASVPNGAPVELWTSDLQRLLDTAFDDERFNVKFRKILEKCNVLCAAEHGKFITFEWMLKYWQKILNGGCNWVLSRDVPKEKPRYQSRDQQIRSTMDAMIAEAEADADKEREEKGI